MIGLIFGETNFPKEVLKKIKILKKKYLILDLTKNNYFKKEKNSFKISVGQIGKIIDILKKNNCRKVLFAGKVQKPNFKKLKLDLKGIYYIPRIIRASKEGDAAILKEVINIFKKEKIKTLSSLTYSPELSLNKKIYTKVKPSKLDKIDINLAIKNLKKLNNFSFSQGAITRGGKNLFIEGSKGTQAMIKKVKRISKSKIGVLVKFPKKKQDLRIDLPTIGIETLKACSRAGLKGVVVKSKQNVCLDKDQIIRFANKNKMFVTAV